MYETYSYLNPFVLELYQKVLQCGSQYSIYQVQAGVSTGDVVKAMKYVEQMIFEKQNNPSGTEHYEYLGFVVSIVMKFTKANVCV